MYDRGGRVLPAQAKLRPCKSPSNNNFQQAVGASASIFKFLDTDDEVKESPGGQLGEFRESIRFENVGSLTGGWRRGEEVLHGIKLESGAEKLWRWLVRAVRGRAAGAFDSAVLRRDQWTAHPSMGATCATSRWLAASAVGIVTQETVLFNDTLRNNIAYGQPNVALERWKQRPRLHWRMILFRALPNGYDTVIGERGVRLSGGERQRLAIARLS